MASRSKRIAVGISLLAITGMLAACSSGGSSSPTPTKSEAVDTTPAQITFVGYGGSGQDAMITAWQKPYTALHPNVTFLNTSPPTVAQVQAQVLAGVTTWDVMNVAPYAAEQNCGTLFEKLKLDVDPKDYPKGTIGNCYVGNFTNGPEFAYNTDKWPDPAKAPKTIADYFDTKKFPGKRGVVATIQDGMLEYPAIADGVKPDKVYPVDINKSLAKWATIRSDTLFAPNVGALQQAAAAGQVDMFFLAESRQLALLDAGVHIKPVWDVTLAALNAFAIPKGSKNVAATTKFIEFTLQPEPSAKMAELAGVSPVNLNSKPVKTKNAEAVDILGKANTGKTIIQDTDYFSKNFNKLQPVLTNWLLG